MDIRKLKKYMRKDVYMYASGVFLLIVFILVYYFGISAPRYFPESMIVSVGDGDSLTTIAKELKADKVIRSEFWFTNFVFLLKREKKVIGGDYYFDRPISAFAVARRLTSGKFNIEQVRTTIPEGSNVFEIAKIIKNKYPNFDSDKFLELAQPKEGYLFPDTYFFGADVGPEKVISAMTSNFSRQIADPKIQASIASSTRSFEDILKMASIVETEVRKTKTRQMVAGILWNRIEKNMALQVDVSFKYVNGKTTADLTLKDLKIDSPYNSYLYKGLPPTPIANPGLDAIWATMNPTKTDYLFFLTDRQGVMHYAKTYAEHSYNQQIYLK